MTVQSIKAKARGQWKQVLVYSTGLPQSVFRDVHQPCPLCKDGDDRYRFDNKKGSGTYFCNRCGAGDGFKFFKKFHSLDEDGAIDKLDEILGISSGDPKINLSAVETFKSVPETTVVVPAPVGAPKPNFYHYKHGNPSKVWTYYDMLGNVFFHICRFDLADGKKDVLPLTYCHYQDFRSKAMAYGWRWKGVTKSDGVKRPLYRLNHVMDSIQAGGDEWILVVEGEKTADAADALFSELICVTWSGGTKSIDNTDWSVLNGRNVIVFCDNDEPGHSANIDIYNKLMLLDPTRTVRIVCAPASKPESWDVADVDLKTANVDSLKQYVSQASFSSLQTELD
ncbi:primase-helicase zinc-binding domain-containing protein [Pseudoalteromonas marina]|uniref:Primase-helicase zinc-binding domain-containing protein n=1 Tax=Pseudoalteromonas marina TaxID=267375 RepID=A0ABT9FCE6_9GAMM|nr:primase-helicase zinc-binding domain-containing protein [Pseudoalteromonas marina]MDP2564305.1 primase-helicase zinc-binding domain-containing protein [Pseudoalteromonas marina]